MIGLPGYRTIAQIYNSYNSLVYRSVREKDLLPVILKVLKEDCPSSHDEHTRYRREYEITRSINKGGVIRAYSLEEFGNTPVIVLEDFGADSLHNLAYRHRFTLEEVLSIASGIAESLHQIHTEHIIHKDINPSNIVFNPANGRLKVIDFGIASLLSRENTTINNPKTLEGTLAYISPEQTGRMNRALDYRTDFYSFGATLYELLTGSPPFSARDAMEMVHCHIAKEPVPPHRIDPKIPEAVSAIVLRLLHKTAEDRYQSALGIKADLDECLGQLRIGGSIQVFPLGVGDSSDRFQIPQKLYGRQEEISILVSAVERLSTPSDADGRKAGKCEIVLVSGYAGIGKTSLVQEVYKPLTGKRGHFISGKFEQLQRDIPYLAFAGAFRDLVHYLLTESESELAVWRKKLLTALGNNARLIIDLIPEVELITGPGPEVVPLPPMEAQNRFDQTLQSFIGVFASGEQPLVIFLDDLHWADAASLRLIELLTSGSQTRNLLLIGAFRDENLNDAHPLSLTMEAIRKSGAEPSHLFLSPLRQEDVNQLVSETLNGSEEDTRPLAELVFARTNGNPFFIKEFLKSLHTEGLIEFDHQDRHWNWDLRKIRSRGATENVIEILANRMLKLRPEAQSILKLSAGVGNRFDLTTISIISKKPPREVLSCLKDLIAEGFIFPLGKSHKLIEFAGPDLWPFPLNAEYKFAHDRIQQAAYSLIPETERKRLHFDAGRALLWNTPDENRPQRILDIVNHLNQAVELIEDAQERDELAELNLTAGLRAKASAAYGAAFKYFAKGMELLGENGWSDRYQLTLQLHSEAAEAAFLNTGFGEMERLIDQVLLHSANLLDGMHAREVRLWSYLARNKLFEAASSGLKICRELGMRLPEKPTRFNILLAMLRTRIKLAGKNVEGFLHLPEMTDPKKLAIMRIIGIISGALHKAFPEIFPLTTFKLTEFSLEHGNAPMSAVAYCGYGMILCSVLGDIDSGYRFGKMAMALTDRMPGYRAMATFVYNGFIRHWKESLRGVLNDLLKNCQTGLETGDIAYAAYSAASYCSNAFLAGKPLGELKAETLKYMRIVGDFKHSGPLYSIMLVHQVVMNLTGQSAAPWRLAGESFDEEKTLPVLEQAGDKTVVFATFMYKTILCFLARDFQGAGQAAKSAEKYLNGVRSMTYIPTWHFYSSLAGLADISGKSLIERRRILKRVGTSRKKMKKWADHAPMNYSHKYLLMEAETARVLGRDLRAMELYDRAIEQAGRNGFLHEEAVANELAAWYYLSRGKARIAGAYLSEARNCYLKWGATEKVRDLETRHPETAFAGSDRQSVGMSLSEAFNTIPPQTVSETDSGALDLTSVMKAAQAISGEIQLERLLARLIEILVENAGAEKGFLILKRGDKMTVEAMVGGETGGADPKGSLPLGECRDLCAAVVAYVARTKENVILSDAGNEGLFTGDDYVQAKHPKSILCTPIMRQSALIGVLYMENNLAVGAFTPERVDTLSILTSQAAISIENARLYSDLVDSEREYRNLYEKFHELYANAIEGIFQSTPDGRVVGANPSTARILGYDSAEELVAAITDIPTQIYVDPEQRINFIRMMERDGRVLDYEAQMSRKDGSQIWVALHARAIRDRGGEIIGLEGSLVDITARKLAQDELKRHQEHLENLVQERTEALRENQRILSTLMSNLPGMAYRCLDDDDWTMEFVSEGSRELFGYLPSELTRDRVVTFGELIHPEDRDYVRKAVRSALEQGAAFQLLYRINTRGGEQKWVWEQGTGVPGRDGRTLAVEGFITDITARKRMEEELLKTQKLESIGVLAAGIAHDFNNLLTTILGNISLAQLNTQPESKEFQYLKSAEEASIQARNLTRQFVTFARGGMPVKDAHPLPGILEDAVSLALTGSNVVCQTKLAGDLRSVNCDPAQIHQAIGNLVINARESMPDGGIIDIEASNICLNDNQVTGLEKGNHVRISIKDHGVGIRPEHLSKVFDPYFSTKERGIQKGMGLGLTSAYAVIKQHGGQITIESVLGIGTNIHIYLPASEQERKESAAKHGPPPGPQKGRILIMDDDEAIRAMVVEMLAQQGFEAVCAKDGTEAVEQYEKAMLGGSPFDAVILDLTVRGGMGGREAIEKLLELDSSVKAIVSSGYSDDTIMSNFSEYGFKAAIPKPFRLHEVAGILSEIVKQ